MGSWGLGHRDEVTGDGVMGMGPGRRGHGDRIMGTGSQGMGSWGHGDGVTGDGVMGMGSQKWGHGDGVMGMGSQELGSQGTGSRGRPAGGEALACLSAAPELIILRALTNLNLTRNFFKKEANLNTELT